MKSPLVPYSGLFVAGEIYNLTIRGVHPLFPEQLSIERLDTNKYQVLCSEAQSLLLGTHVKLFTGSKLVRTETWYAIRLDSAGFDLRSNRVGLY